MERLAASPWPKILLGLALPLFVLLMPGSWLPLESVTIVEQRVVALFLFAALFWILEPIPVYATSILIVVLELIMVSDKGFVLLREGYDPAQLGELLSYKEIMATFASPIILLFLGGFFLAMAATKFRLDQNLARVLLKPFGTQPKWVMLGLMVITAFFSMFMSNTATTAMMLSILVPVLAVFEPADRGRMGFVLAIPVAANIGGLGTPIGTPPNVIALKYLAGDNLISFGQWMAFGLPMVIVLLLGAWAMLLALFPIETQAIKLNIKGKFQRSLKARLVYVTFALTVLLWLTDFIHGMNAYIVAMIPMGVFLTTNIITKEDLKNISWDVLWLVTGGIALGYALGESGLALNLVESIPFASYSPYLILLAASLLGIVMATFMSNTATANLLLPIIAALGTSISSLEIVGGSKALILGVALSTALGMALPISTPPNALAHATGYIESRDMMKIGVPVGIVGLLCIYLMLFIMKAVGFV
jgi:sodium-dependent dicarboxylate transporter 2/3/5